MRLAMTLELPAQASLLGKTRRAIAGYMEEVGATEEQIDDVMLAVGEACANVLRHAEGRYRMSIVLTEQTAVVEVADSGRGFEVEQLGRTTIDLSESGRGLQMIQHLMTDVEVESPTPEGGTRLKMSKQLD